MATPGHPAEASQPGASDEQGGQAWTSDQGQQSSYAWQPSSDSWGAWQWNSASPWYQTWPPNSWSWTNWSGGWRGDQSYQWQGTGGNDQAGHTSEQSRPQAHEERRGSASTMEPDPPSEVRDNSDKLSIEEEENGSSSASKPPRTGKDFIPEYDGKTPLREYRRRVKLFEASTGIDPEYRAQKLMERLSGDAWLATETIDIASLKAADGVERLIQHLYQELEPLEFLRVFQTLEEFYKNFRRSKGQEFTAFDTSFRSQLQRLEEVGAPIAGTTKAFWFLEKSGISAELRKQVVAAAGGVYEYSKLRAALVAIVPQVNRHVADEATTPARSWRQKPSGPANKVHAVEQDDGEDQDMQDEPGEGELEQLESELQVLMTQAARKRASIEKARGFSKNESSEERSKRIQDMKSRMPCSACKARGRTSYGHWHSDPVCPYYGDKTDKPDKGKQGGKQVMAVVEQELTDSDEAFDVHMVAAQVFSMVGDIKDSHRIALSDTCCARTVVGEPWARKHMKSLIKRGLPVFIIDESRPFRFGGSPTVTSSYAMIFPIFFPDSYQQVIIRASVVNQDVPLLVSRPAMKELGAILNLADGVMNFEKIKVVVPLQQTAGGLCGFEIDHRDSKFDGELPWEKMVNEDREVLVVEGGNKDGLSRTGGVGLKYDLSEHPEPHESRPKDRNSPTHETISTAHMHQQSCSQHRLTPKLNQQALDFPRQQQPPQHVHACAQEEGRVCLSHSGQDPGDSSGSSGTLRRQVEGSVGGSQAKESASASRQLEERHSGVSEGVVCRGHRPGVPDGAGLPLADDAPLRAGLLHGGLCEGNGGGVQEQPPPRAGLPRSSGVLNVCSTNGVPQEPADGRGLLGMPTIPIMQEDVALPVRHTSYSTSATRDGSVLEGDGKANAQRPAKAIPDTAEDEAGQPAPGWLRQRLGWIVGASRSHSIGHSLFGRGAQVQHQPVRGGDGDDRPPEAGEGSQGRQEACQAGGEGREFHDGDQVSCAKPADAESHFPEHSGQPKLSSSQVRDRIAKGRERRAHMKKGVARRLLGNVKQLACSVMIVGMAALGAGASGLIPAHVSRPDCLEVFAGKAVVSDQFSR